MKCVNGNAKVIYGRGMVITTPQVKNDFSIGKLYVQENGKGTIGERFDNNVYRLNKDKDMVEIEFENIESLIVFKKSIDELYQMMNGNLGGCVEDKLFEPKEGGGRIMERLVDKQLENIEKIYESVPMGGKIQFSKPAIEAMHMALKELKEYKDLEEQGKLIKLPCKVGDTVYFINPRKQISRKNVTGIIFKDDRTVCIETDWCYFDSSDFSRTVFTNKEEAEAKLKEIENE